jgi:hypothetical protein
MFQFWWDFERLTCSEGFQILEIMLGTCCCYEKTGELGILDCETASCGTAAIDQENRFLGGGFGWQGKF